MRGRRFRSWGNLVHWLDSQSTQAIRFPHEMRHQRMEEIALVLWGVGFRACRRQVRLQFERSVGLHISHAELDPCHPDLWDEDSRG